MRQVLWTPAMVETILQHLENKKGDQGLYMIDRRAAFNEVTELLTKTPESNPVDARQVAYKFQTLFYHHRNRDYSNINTFFNLGRIVLNPRFNQRLCGSSKGDDHEETLSDDNGSSHESSDQESPKHPSRKRPSLETPRSSSRKKSK